MKRSLSSFPIFFFNESLPVRTLYFFFTLNIFVVNRAFSDSSVKKAQLSFHPFCFKNRSGEQNTISLLLDTAEPFDLQRLSIAPYCSGRVLRLI